MIHIVTVAPLMLPCAAGAAALTVLLLLLSELSPPPHATTVDPSSANAMAASQMRALFPLLIRSHSLFQKRLRKTCESNLMRSWRSPPSPLTALFARRLA
jgi:hypothetical protein